jgi:ABC-type bacteriocin/lantibiotic exporter with double-glycine peptidase domain/CRP-like cAMP-binding protein
VIESTLISQTLDDSGMKRAVNQFKKNNALAIFPTIVDSLIAAGDVIEFSEGKIAQLERKPISNIIVPLTGAFSVSIYTGLLSDEAILEVVPLGSFIGLIEVLDGKRSPMTIKAEEDSWALVVPVAAVKKILTPEKESLKAIRLLCASLAIDNFCRRLRGRKVSLESLVQILNAIDSLPKRYTKELGLGADRGVFFLQAGRVFIRNGNESFALDSGQYFGGSVLQGKFPYEISLLESCYFHLLNLSKLRDEVRVFLLPFIAEEPCFPRQISDRTALIKADSIPGVNYTQHETEVIDQFFTDAPIGDMVFSATSESWGFCALANWCSLLGLEIGKRDIQTFVQLNSKLTPLRIAKFTERFGHVTRSEFAPPSGRAVNFPGLAFFCGRPVVLLGFKASNVYWLDPSLGAVSAPWSNFFSKWDGQYLSIDDDDRQDAAGLAAVKESNKAKVARSFLRSNLSKVTTWTTNIVFLEFFGMLVALLFPPLIMHFLRDSLKANDIRYLPLYLLGFGIIVVFQALSGFLSALFQQWQDSSHGFRINSQFFRQYLNVSAGSAKVQGGKFLAKPHMFTFYQHGLSMITNKLPAKLVFLGLLLAIFSLYSIQLTMFFVLMVGLAQGGSWLMAKMRKASYTGLANSQLEVYECLTEFCAAFASIKSYSIEEKIREKVERSYFDLQNLEFEISQAESSRSYFIDVVTMLMIFGGLYFAVVEMKDGRIDLAAFVTLSMYIGFLVSPVQQIANLLAIKAITKGGAESFLPEAPSPRILNHANEISMELRGEITFDKVSFKYSEKSPNAVRDISFTVKPGQVVAIVGRSGSGKTTLAKLVAAQLNPSAGRISYDGFETREIASGSLREQIGFVAQDLQLFSGSILSNIAYDEDSPDLDLVKAAAKVSYAHQFIRALPNHYFYNLSEMGAGLSTGQKHQIALARTLYKKPRLLVIDEATAYLDPESEKAISDSISRLMINKTVFLVIHRLYVARRADLILVMKNGALTEIGRHEDLIRKNGEYTELYRHQIGMEDA